MAGRLTRYSLGRDPVSQAVDMRTLTYDTAGNLITDGATAAYGYDNAGRRTTAILNSQPWQYAYNGLGQRVKKTGAGTTTLYAYDEQGHLLGEYDATGKLIQETVWLGDLPVATLRYPSGTTSGPATPYYVVIPPFLGAAVLTRAEN